MTDDIKPEITLELLKTNPDILSIYKEVIFAKRSYANRRQRRVIIITLLTVPILGVALLFYNGVLALNSSNLLTSAMFILLNATSFTFTVWFLERMTLRGLRLNDVGQEFFWTEFFTSDAEFVLRYIKCFENKKGANHES